MGARSSATASNVGFNPMELEATEISTTATETAVLAKTGVSLSALPGNGSMGGCQVEAAARERAKIAMLKPRTTSGGTKPT